MQRCVLLFLYLYEWDAVGDHNRTSLERIHTIFQPYMVLGWAQNIVY